MTNPDNLIARINAEIDIERQCGNINLNDGVGRVLVEARDMIRTLRKERDESEAANFIVGYN